MAWKGPAERHRKCIAIGPSGHLGIFPKKLVKGAHDLPPVQTGRTIDFLGQDPTLDTPEPDVAKRADIFRSIRHGGRNRWGRKRSVAEGVCCARLQRRAFGRRMGGEISGDRDEDVPALIGVAPKGELPDPRLQHLVRMEAGIFPKHRPRERGDQHLRRNSMTRLNAPASAMACASAAMRSADSAS